MKQLILLIPGCLLFRTGIAQKDSYGELWRHTVKVAPVKPLNPLEPGMEAAYEYRFNYRWATQVNAGVIFQPFQFDVIDSRRGFSGGIDQRLYMERYGNWLSAGIGYAQYTTECSDYFFQPDDTMPIPYPDTAGVFDRFSVDKKVVFFTLRLGRSVEIGEHFGFEGSAGFSLIYREATYRSYDYPWPEYRRQPRQTFLGSALTEGKYWFFRVPLQLRITYSF